jgi:ATP-independent RNA helicase DbpA
VLDHLFRETLNLDALNTLVLDEADRMLDMGFHDDMVKVMRQCPKFSATYPEDIARLARQFMRDAQTVKVDVRHASQHIRELFSRWRQPSACPPWPGCWRISGPRARWPSATPQQCRDLVELLQAQGFDALALHGELEQRERDQVLVQFANRSCSVLVATDVAARGLDIAQLAAVINVDISPDPEVHVHRIGRTGRAGELAWRSAWRPWTRWAASAASSSSPGSRRSGRAWTRSRQRPGRPCAPP